MWKLFAKKARRNFGGSKGGTPLVRKKIEKPLPLPSGITPYKLKTRDLNALGRLEAYELSRSVPDVRRFENRNLEEKREFIRPMIIRDFTNPDKMVFRKDSEICRERQRRRDSIMKKTKGKGMRVKNALWNFTSFIQCK